MDRFATEKADSDCPATLIHRMNTTEVFMSKCVDLTGQKFGRLTVIKRINNYISPSGSKKSQWLCQCECGNFINVVGQALTRNKTKSCGCLNRDNIEKKKNLSSKHPRLHQIWCDIRQRTRNPKNCNAKNYLERGITICKEWDNFDNFCKWALDNGYNENAKNYTCTIDRINNDGNYEPNNCRWVTLKEQSKNKRTTRLFTYMNKTLCLKDWASEMKINYGTLRFRIKNGMPFEEALTKPINIKFSPIIRGK